ncbi:MAG: nucleotide exchange factor GrpE [bacterium]|nr:nucleotide exchange factor GrpE [bacterium]
MKEKDSDKEKKPEAQAEEYLAGWKRAKADLENYKKEETQRLDSVRKFACESLISEMLTVLDSFNFALTSSKDEDTKKGVLMIKSQLEEALKRSGLEKIEVKAGDKFDESLHEAMEGDGDKILEIVSEGYKLNGKLIRAARVRLGDSL